MPNPTWIAVNAGLTQAQYQSINFFFVTPSGAFYAGKAGGQSSTSAGGFFLARAPRIGATFEILYDINNLWNGSGRWGISGCNYNKLLPDTVGIVMTESLDSTPTFWLGSAGTFVKKVAVSIQDYTFPIYVSYGFGKWMTSSYGAQAGGKVRLLPPDGSSVAFAPANHNNMSPGHVRAGTTARTFHPRGGGGMFIGIDNFTSYDEIVDTALHFEPISVASHELPLACDPLGTYVMGPYGPGNKGRSTDGGYTWLAMPNLTAGNWFYSYAGGAGSSSRWIAISGSSIKYSENFGDSWSDAVGNLTNLVPIPSLNMVKAII